MLGVWVLTTADLANTCLESDSDEEVIPVEEEAPVVEVVGNGKEADLELG